MTRLRLSIGEGDIFMFCAIDAAGRRSGPWHAPARVGGLKPIDGVHIANCGVKVSLARLKALRLPFTIGLDMPPVRTICKACKF